MRGRIEGVRSDTGCPFGSHRAHGVLLQQAERLDTDCLIWSNELLIEVEMLNLDSSSMRQLEDSCEGRSNQIKHRILEIVRTRGKMHNPVTGSGGMLIGRVAALGPGFPDPSLQIGEQICTLVSLSLTPLALSDIGAIDRAAAQIHVRGQAILFESGLFTRLPQDIPESIAVSLFDVAGAPATVVKVSRPGDRICIFGAGKAGMLCLVAAREILGNTGQLVAVEGVADVVEEIRRLGVADQVFHLDSRDAIGTYQVLRYTMGRVTVRFNDQHHEYRKYRGCLDSGDKAWWEPHTFQYVDFLHSCGPDGGGRGPRHRHANRQRFYKELD